MRKEEDKKVRKSEVHGEELDDVGGWIGAYLDVGCSNKTNKRPVLLRWYSTDSFGIHPSSI